MYLPTAVSKIPTPCRATSEEDAPGLAGSPGFRCCHSYMLVETNKLGSHASQSAIMLIKILRLARVCRPGTFEFATFLARENRRSACSVRAQKKSFTGQAPAGLLMDFIAGCHFEGVSPGSSESCALAPFENSAPPGMRWHGSTPGALLIPSRRWKLSSSKPPKPSFPAKP